MEDPSPGPWNMTPTKGIHFMSQFSLFPVFQNRSVTLRWAHQTLLYHLHRLQCFIAFSTAHQLQLQLQVAGICGTGVQAWQELWSHDTHKTCNTDSSIVSLCFKQFQTKCSLFKKVSKALTPPKHATVILLLITWLLSIEECWLVTGSIMNCKAVTSTKLAINILICFFHIVINKLNHVYC